MRNPTDEIIFPQHELWDSLTKHQPLEYKPRDCQIWDIAVWAIENPTDRLVYVQEAVSDAHWIEIMRCMQCGDEAGIGRLVVQALCTKEMCARVDAEEEA